MSTRLLLLLLVAIAAAILICEAQQLVALGNYDIENAERSGTVLRGVADEALRRSPDLPEGAAVDVIAYVHLDGEVRRHSWSVGATPVEELDCGQMCERESGMEAYEAMMEYEATREEVDEKTPPAPAADAEAPVPLYAD